jgi:uncharacterized protein
MLVEPVGLSRANVDAIQNETFRCIVCGQRMQKVEPKVVLAHLPLPQKIALRLGRIRVDGWACPSCQPHLDKFALHLRVYPLNYWKEEKFCAVCQEFTADCIEEVNSEQPSFMQKCYCCELVKENNEKAASISIDCESN